MPKYAEILINKQNIYTYAIPDGLTDKVEIGNEVSLKLRNKKTSGFVVRFVEKPEFATKEIESKISDRVYFDDKLVQLAEYTSQKYKCFLATALKAILPR